MIPQQYQAASMQVNPQLARSIEETVTNLKNLESCIDSLRNDLAVVAESTGNTQALQRLLAPAQIPSAAAGAQAPWEAQQQFGQIGNPAASVAGGIGDPYETSLNPYAQASAAPFTQAWGANPAIAPHAVNPAAIGAPHTQAYAPHAAQMRQAEIARHAAYAPWATQTTPLAHQAAFARTAAIPQVAPYAAQVPHLSARAAFAHQQVPHLAAQAPYASQTPHLAAQNPYATQTHLSAQNPYATQAPLAAQSPFAHQQAPHFASQGAIPQQQVPQFAAQSPAAQADPASRQLAAASLNPGATVGPF